MITLPEARRRSSAHIQPYRVATVSGGLFWCPCWTLMVISPSDVSVRWVVVRPCRACIAVLRWPTNRSSVVATNAPM